MRVAQNGPGLLIQEKFLKRNKKWKKIEKFNTWQNMRKIESKLKYLIKKRGQFQFFHILKTENRIYDFIIYNKIFLKEIGVFDGVSSEKIAQKRKRGKK